MWSTLLYTVLIFSWDYKKDIVDRFYDFAISNRDYPFWKDDKNGLMNDINEDMAQGVENSKLVLAFFSEPYFDSKSCKKELNYADVLGNGLGFHITQTCVMLYDSYCMTHMI